MPESNEQSKPALAEVASADLLAGLLDPHSKHHAAMAIEVMEDHRRSDRPLITSAIQRRLRVGYNLACTILAAMEQLGLIKESDNPRSLRYIIC